MEKIEKDLLNSQEELFSSIEKERKNMLLLFSVSIFVNVLGIIISICIRHWSELLLWFALLCCSISLKITTSHVLFWKEQCFKQLFKLFSFIKSNGKKKTVASHLSSM